MEKPKGKSGTGEPPVRAFSGPRYRLGSETGKRKLTLRKHVVSPEQKQQITDRIVRYLEKRPEVGVEGRLILDRDPEARAEFQARSLKAYFDFAPVRRRCFGEK